MVLHYFSVLVSHCLGSLYSGLVYLSKCLCECYIWRVTIACLSSFLSNVSLEEVLMYDMDVAMVAATAFCISLLKPSVNWRAHCCVVSEWFAET